MPKKLLKTVHTETDRQIFKTVETNTVENRK